MENLDIEEGKLTPKVLFDPTDNLFSLSGSSLPENVHEFYQPIMKYLDEYEAQLDDLDKPLKIVIHFAYYNSGSMRYIADIFSRFARFEKKGLEINVDWYYDKEDELLKEAGQDLAELVGLKFNILSA